MKLVIVGSRTFDNYELLCQEIDKLKIFYQIDTIVSGGAIGADSLGKFYAQEHNLPLLIFSADWKKYGKSAGMIRNQDIINASDYIIAFWDGVSRGTKDSIRKADECKKKYKIIYFQ